MTLQLVDSHCHLDDDRFDQDRQQVVDRARALGIHQMVVPATTRLRWPRVEQVAEIYADVYAADGLHPMFMDEHQPQDVEALDAWLDAHPAVAVGECGLDFFRGDEDQQAQLELFRGQLKIARNHDLPVIIHARKALDLVLREIRLSGIEKGVVHSFSGSLQQARQLVDHGFKLGIAAIVGYDRAKKLQQVVRQVGVESLLIETDAPDQSGPGHRGERNEPAYIVDHLSKIAELRDMDEAACAQQLALNCQQLFGLPA